MCERSRRPSSSSPRLTGSATCWHKYPRGVDLWEVDRSVVGSSSAAHKLHAALDGLRDVGWVTAGKLMAAKRPRLIPILDKEVKTVLKPPKEHFWVTMHDELSDDSRRQKIADVCHPKETASLN